MKIEGKEVLVNIIQVSEATPETLDHYKKLLLSLAEDSGKKIEGTARLLVFSFLRAERAAFLRHAIRFAREIIYSVLKKHPELITSENFRVDVIIELNDPEKGETLAAYRPHRSNDRQATIILYLLCIVHHLGEYGDRELTSIIYHEMIHHLQLPYTKKTKHAIESMSANYPQYTWLNPSTIFGLLVELFKEGVTSFGQNFELHNGVTFKKEKLSRVKDVLNNPPVPSLEKMKKRYAIYDKINDFLFYGAGVQLVCIIAIYTLKVKGMLEYMYIARKRFGRFRAEYKIDKIRKFYGKKDFAVFFIKDSDLDQIIRELIVRLTNSSHIDFLKEYEVACLSLGIEPTITIASYNRFKQGAWQTLQFVRKLTEK